MTADFERQYAQYISQTKKIEELNYMIEELYITGTRQQKYMRALRDGLINQEEYHMLKERY